MKETGQHGVKGGGDTIHLPGLYNFDKADVKREAKKWIWSQKLTLQKSKTPKIEDRKNEIWQYNVKYS